MTKAQWTRAVFITLMCLSVSAAAQDTGIRDSIGAYCPIWGSYEVGETLRVPIFVFTDQNVYSLRFIFDCGCPSLRFIGADLAPSISSFGGNTRFEVGEVVAPGTVDTANSIVLARLPELVGGYPPPPFKPSQERQLFVTIKFLVLESSCCNVDIDTTSSGDFAYTYFSGGVAYRPATSWCPYSESSINCSLGLEDSREILEPGGSICATFPNPFNSGAVIQVRVEARQRILIEIFDVIGRRVRLLSNTETNPGTSDFFWDGTDDSGKSAASGVYFARVVAGNRTETKKLVLLR